MNVNEILTIVCVWVVIICLIITGYQTHVEILQPGRSGCSLVFKTNDNKDNKDNNVTKILKI